MRTNRIMTVMLAGATAVFLLSFLWWTAAAIQADSSPTPRPSSRSLVASQTGSPSADNGLLLIADSINKRVMAFDPISGNPIDLDFITLPAGTPGVMSHAILGPDSHVYVSIGSVVRRYDWDGNDLGVFAPAGGANTAIMENIRGIAFRPNGHLLVTVAANNNAHTVVEFDPAGNYLGRFIEGGALNAPTYIHGREENDWLVSSSTNSLVKRYNWTTGVFIGDLATISSSPQQIHQLANGNLLVANRLGTQGGIVELMPGGQLVGVYTASGLSTYRGVYQLPNGNILTSTNTGVYEIDRNGNLIATKYVGEARFISYARPPHIQLRTTVGLTSACADTEMIAVPPTTTVTYCYQISNNSGLTLTTHDLVDSHQGSVFTGLAFSIPTGGTAFYTTTVTLTETTVSSAEWTAYNPGPTDVFTATSKATVKVVPPSISLKVTVNDGDGCGNAKHILVREGTAVTYCFTVFNTGLTTLSRHELVDTYFGAMIPSGQPVEQDLAPNASVLFIHTAVITETVINTATWTAYNPGPTDVATANDSARVSIIVQDIFLPIIAKP
jgi:hypothetical protein